MQAHPDTHKHAHTFQKTHSTQTINPTHSHMYGLFMVLGLIEMHGSPRECETFQNGFGKDRPHLSLANCEGSFPLIGAPVTEKKQRCIFFPPLRSVNTG